MIPQIEIPRVFLPLLKPSRYKGIHGGRGSGKSHFLAELLLMRMITARTDWVCLREVQKTLDQSVKKLIEGKIIRYGLGHMFDVQVAKIKCINGGVIIFQGMQDHTADSIKSLEGFDGAWFEESQTMSARSLELLRPTIRKPGSEIWFSWNPKSIDDPVDMFLRGKEERHDRIVIQANYTDNSRCPDVLINEANDCLREQPDLYPHIWLGQYRPGDELSVIPFAWANAAIDAHKKLGIEMTGATSGALDVADEGADLNAFAVKTGMLLHHVSAWSGKGSDIYGTVERAFTLCDTLDCQSFVYDADGLGSGVRGDARKINEQRSQHNTLRVEPFRGSASPSRPEYMLIEKRKNKDTFANEKARAWWHLRLLFRNTYRAVVEGMDYDPDQILSIDGSIPDIERLLVELSQPTYDTNNMGKFIINKKPDDTRSPNKADAIMMLYSGVGQQMTINYDGRFAR